MPMDFASNYEIARTADYIRSKNFTRVALQFPDELLKDSTRVVRELRAELWRSGNVSDVGLYVMADTAYGSCCVDEVGASHISADCVVHYGHTCLSPTSTLPAFFVFGKASINVNACAKSLSDCLSTSDKPIMVLYGLEYVHAVQSIKEAAIVESSKLCQSNLGIYYADVICSALNPSKENKTDNRLPGSFNDFSSNGELSDSIEGSRIGQQMNSTTAGTSYNLGGLTWNLPEGRKMVDCLLFWIGSDNPAFANFVLTFNDSEIVRYEADRNCLVKDLSHKKRILKRRYYLVEKAKDANIIGILVGTLGIAGYLQMIHRMKDLIKGVGKKAYILVMGKPNPAKLANFPECDVFIYVSCAQTALLDSKEFLAPVITPFEAMLAFNRGSQWTGEYVMEFRDLMASSLENGNRTEEARFSFLQGGYVEDLRVQGEQEEIGLALAEATEKSLKVQGKSTSSVFVKGTAKSGAEFLAARSYRGLEVHSDKLSPRSFVMGRSGKASGYEDEKNKQED